MDLINYVCHDYVLVPGGDRDITGEHAVYLLVARVNQKRVSAQRKDFVPGGNDHDVFRPHPAYDFGGDLLVSPAENISLSSDHSDYDFSPGILLKRCQDILLRAV